MLRQLLALFLKVPENNRDIRRQESHEAAAGWTIGFSIIYSNCYLPAGDKALLFQGLKSSFKFQINSTAGPYLDEGKTNGCF